VRQSGLAASGLQGVKKRRESGLNTWPVHRMLESGCEILPTVGLEASIGVENQDLLAEEDEANTSCKTNHSPPQSLQRAVAAVQSKSFPLFLLRSDRST